MFEDENKRNIIILVIILLALIAIPSISVLNDKKSGNNSNSNIENKDTNKKDDSSNKDNTKEDSSSLNDDNSNSTNKNNDLNNGDSSSNNSTSRNNSSSTNGNNNSNSNSASGRSQRVNPSNPVTSGDGDYVDGYSKDVGIDNNSSSSYTEDPSNNYEYDFEDDEEEIVDNTTVSDYGNGLSTDGNQKSNLNIKLNLTNAPYDNKEYCEDKLNKTYKIRLSDKPNGSTCSDYPTSITFGEGSLDVEKHRYTKLANIDFSNTKFSSLGDYYFDIYDVDTNKTLYQVIITFRNVTDDNNSPLPQTYSLIQIKSILKDGEKVENININLKNPNTYITLEHIKDKDSFLENVYIDLVIDSYDNELYTVVDGNLYDSALNKEDKDYSKLKIGNHYVIRQDNEIVVQTYQLTNGGKVYVGRNYTGLLAFTKPKFSLFPIVYASEIDENDIYQIPVGTKYKATLTKGKKYREAYEVSGSDDSRVAEIDSSSNRILIKNVTKGNPKTGLFYTIIPFVIVICIAVVGIILLKKMKIKDNNKDEK